MSGEEKKIYEIDFDYDLTQFVISEHKKDSKVFNNFYKPNRLFKNVVE